MTAEERESWIFEEGISPREEERRIMHCHRYIFGKSPLDLSGALVKLYIPRQTISCMMALTCNCGRRDDPYVEPMYAQLELTDLFQVSFNITSVVKQSVDDCSIIHLGCPEAVNIDAWIKTVHKRSETVAAAISWLGSNPVSWSSNPGDFRWDMQLSVTFGDEKHLFEPDFECEIQGLDW